jgi:hypothetical protein
MRRGEDNRDCDETVILRTGEKWREQERSGEVYGGAVLQHTGHERIVR